ncbi:origin recognition complex subunit 4 [Chytridiales sp. JEL 0842]|nr:origin recognition complex subunit 4 [Chytridiales sp. JEL 0842]
MPTSATKRHSADPDSPRKKPLRESLGEQLYSEEEDADSLKKIAAIILSRLSTHHLPNKLVDLEDDYGKVRDIILSTVCKGESNSAIVVGDRGSGKSTIIRSAISLLRKESKANTFYDIWLNGFLQTDDRIAMREIARQLHKEAELEQKRPSTMAECLSFLLSTLKAGSKDNIPVVFILEEFDLFALHHKQALLYNLFDVAQTSGSPVAVIGVTCRMDSIELLEKRVKSRFSHRFILIKPVESLDSWYSILRSILVFKKEDGLNEGTIKQFNNGILSILENQECKDIIQRVKMIMSSSTDSPFPSAGAFLKSAFEQSKDQLSAQISGLSSLELCILVAMHQCTLRHLEAVNFEIVYDVYRDFLRTTNSAHLAYKRGVVYKAYENLMSLELISAIDGVATKCPNEHRMSRFMLTTADVNRVIESHPSCPDVVKKWSRSL